MALDTMLMRHFSDTRNQSMKQGRSQITKRKSTRDLVGGGGWAGTYIIKGARRYLGITKALDTLVAKRPSHAAVPSIPLRTMSLLAHPTNRQAVHPRARIDDQGGQ